MQTTPITRDDLARSVVSVPPLARNDDLSLNAEENQKLIGHLESGGVSTLLYGGNALLYHIAPSQYADLLGQLEAWAAEDTLVIPSVGSSYGMMMDQAKVLCNTAYPTAMVLPQPNVVTYEGVERAIGDFVQAAGSQLWSTSSSWAISKLRMLRDWWKVGRFRGSNMRLSKMILQSMNI